ncbi:YidC/Oxa1 family membrane protein insertase [Clostridium omnivorum]|uniref:Membrane protein n=1 Tax=Clostridium omnivorum TaxID=1604902 RepID=A0ABQ5N8G1_9CLOT|nr:YidC/Oxa1 family membrane protein insertase [Clostridium sp. E14]GLC31529.1 membrane protein [Clostridium sp. E14]
MNIIFDFLSFLLNNLFLFTKDFGIAIVILTILVRLLLMPLSLKQKINMVKQQKISVKINELKEKYKSNPKKLESELQEFYKENSKTYLGCLVSFMQLPIIFTLYNVVLKIPMEVSTVIVPWVSNLKAVDKFYIIPVLYTISVMLPNFLPAAQYMKAYKTEKTSKLATIINSLVGSTVSLFITIKAPVALGLYFITSSIFSLVEELIFRVYIKSKPIAN